MGTDGVVWDEATRGTLLRLAELDGQLAELDGRRAIAVDEENVAALTALRRRLRDGEVAAGLRAEDLDRELDRIRRDRDVLRSRHSHQAAELAGPGLDRGARRELERDQVSVARRIEAVEREIADVTALRAAVDEDIRRSAAAVADAEEQLATLRGAVADEAAAADEAATARRKERVALTAVLSAPVLADYDAARARTGVGAVPLTGVRCGACRMDMGVGVVEQLRRSPLTEPLACPECGTLLVREGSR